MKFQFSHHPADPPARFFHRLFSIIPGLASWGIIGGVAFLTFAKPLAAALVVMIFDFYWLLRLAYLMIFLLLSYFKLNRAKKISWNRRLETLDRWLRDRRFEGVKDAELRRDLNLLSAGESPPPASKEILHVVIIPASAESAEVIRPGVESIVKGHFSSKQIWIVIALEERAGKSLKGDIDALAREHRDSLLDFWVLVHPEGLPGEAKVKGANITYAARQVARELQTRKIPLDHVVVSCFDADTVVSPEYFSCLTYNFMICPTRHRTSYQPIPVYHNNIWKTAGFARVLEMGASFYQLIEATDPEKLVTFSSHSMSFKALAEVGYWPMDMVSDDSAIYWKAFLHYEGKYRVVPLYVTVSMDVIQSPSLWQTAVRVYQQKRRWAWGVENFPIVMLGFLSIGRISWYDKIRYGFKLLEGHLAWATWPILLTILSWLPAVVAGREFSGTVLYFNAPRVTAVIFNLAVLSLAISIFLSLRLLPKKPVRGSIWQNGMHALEWLAIPVIMVFWSAFPALDAQTRLMLGRNLAFNVTEKGK